MADVGSLKDKIHALQLEKHAADLEFDTKLAALKSNLLQTTSEAFSASLSSESPMHDSEEKNESSESVEVDSESVDSEEGLREGPRSSLICARLTRAMSYASLEGEDELKPSEVVTSEYGTDLPSPEEAADLVPAGEEGLIWHAIVISDGYKNKKDIVDGRIKARRPTPTVTKENFFASLVKTPDGRWIFKGVLNGWPGLRLFELTSITIKKPGNLVKKARIKRYWQTGITQEDPSYPKENPGSVRVTLRAPAWSAYGWSKDSPGCIWWNFAQDEKPCMKHGEDIIREVVAKAKREGEPEPIATRVHAFAHRYARGDQPETQKHKITWHTLVLIEWSHGKHCTVIELATLNGVGGRFGKSNWYDDKLDARPGLYQNFPASMVMPWKGEFCEVRCADVKSKNGEEFKEFLQKYTGPQLRFLAPDHISSADIRVSHNKQSDILRALLNYTARDRRYTEEFRNCQTFYSDFYGFLVGKAGIKPYFAGNRAFYKPRQHMFLYDPNMYEFADINTHHK